MDIHNKVCLPKTNTMHHNHTPKCFKYMMAIHNDSWFWVSLPLAIGLVEGSNAPASYDLHDSGIMLVFSGAHKVVDHN